MQTESFHPRPLEAQSFPAESGLSYPELSLYLSYLANSEAKALLIIAMQPNTSYTRTGLRNLFNGIQGAIPGWKTNDTTAASWCQQTLVKAGLVEIEEGEDYGSFLVSKTEKGHELGASLAGHLLLFSEKYPQLNLNHLLGRSGSVSKTEAEDTAQGKIDYKVTAPDTTYRILYGLTTSPLLPIRVVDLARTIRVADKRLSTHLERLESLGMLGYDYAIPDEQISAYSLNEDSPESDPEPYRNQTRISRRIYELLQKTPKTDLTIDEVKALLLNSEYGNGYEDSEYLRKQISHILANLERQGYLHRIDPGYKYNNKSTISLTQEQAEVIAFFVGMIQSFQSQDQGFISKGKRLAQEILENPQRVARLAEKARNASSGVNSDVIQTEIDILSIVRMNPHITTTGIHHVLLAEPFNKRYSTARISDALNRLMSNNQVAIAKKGTAIYWKVSPESE